VQILDLPTGQMLALSADKAHHVQVLYGRVWLTETGRSEDVFAGSGEVIDLSRRGLVLVEGLGFARIAVVTRARRSGLRLPRSLLSAGRATKATLRRWLAAVVPGGRSARPIA
jgi:hypothetical protein